MDIKGFKTKDGTVHKYDYGSLANTPETEGNDGGYYTPSATQPSENKLEFAFTPSKTDMPSVNPVQVTLPAGSGSGGNVDLGLTGATVGQTVKISAVDENGAPTAWEPVAFPGEVWEDVCDVTIGDDVYVQHILSVSEGAGFKKLEIACAGNTGKYIRFAFGVPGAALPDTNSSVYLSPYMGWIPGGEYSRCSIYPVADSFFGTDKFHNAGAATSWDPENTVLRTPVWSKSTGTGSYTGKFYNTYNNGGIGEIRIYSINSSYPIAPGCRIIIRGVRF